MNIADTLSALSNLGAYLAIGAFALLVLTLVVDLFTLLVKKESPWYLDLVAGFSTWGVLAGAVLFIIANGAAWLLLAHRGQP